MDSVVVDEIVRTPIVYVVQEGRQNVLPALEFGSLEPLLGPDSQIIMNSKAAIAQIKAKMTSFTDMDYIVCIGDPAAIGIVCALAAQMNGGRFTVLKWDRQEHVYYPVHVDLNVD
jgi:hypothetical protein